MWQRSIKLFFPFLTAACFYTPPPPKKGKQGFRVRVRLGVRVGVGVGMGVGVGVHVRVGMRVLALGICRHLQGINNYAAVMKPV